MTNTEEKQLGTYREFIKSKTEQTDDEKGFEEFIRNEKVKKENSDK